MFNFFRQFFERLFGEDDFDEDDFIGVEGINDEEGEGIRFDIEEVEENSLLWEYWIEEPLGEQVTSGGDFYSIEDAVNYVDGAPYGVLWIYIDPDDGGIEVYRYYEG